KGDLRHQADPAGLAHDYTYDEIGRQLTSKETSDTYPAGLNTTFTYDPLSRVATETDPGVANLVAGTTHTQATTNTYDLNENLSQSVVSDSTGGDAQRATVYLYDNDDRKIYQTDGAGSFTWATYATTYDANGNIDTSTDPDGTVTAYTYTDSN